MKNTKDLLMEFSLSINSSFTSKAYEISYDIYESLINNGYLPGQLVDEDHIIEIIEDKYEVFLNQDTKEILIEALSDIAESDLSVDEYEENEEALRQKKYIVVVYKVDVESGTTGRRLIPLVFANIKDVANYINFQLELKSTAGKLDNSDEKYGYTNILAYEDLYEVLQGMEVPYEAIAEAIPETCEGACVLSTESTTTGKVSKADVFALYEVSNYPEIDEWL